ARERNTAVSEAVAAVERAMTGIDREAAVIAEAAAAIRTRCQDFVAVLNGVASGVELSSGALQRARDRVMELAKISQALSTAPAASGLDTIDTPFIHRVSADAARLSALLEAELARGAVSETDLFDETYVPIPGSNPAQVRTKFLALTDRLFPEV